MAMVKIFGNCEIAWAKMMMCIVIAQMVIVINKL